MIELRLKIIEWFIKDIKEQLSWTDADISDEDIKVIAADKADDLIKKCLPAALQNLCYYDYVNELINYVDLLKEETL